MQMRALTEGGRAMSYYAIAAEDRSSHHPDEQVRAQSAQMVELLTPLVKGWCTEVAMESTSLGVQVHGGMGFIEETGAAQHMRDARILPIYEGTNGIQAIDLVTRKVLRDGGLAARRYIEEIDAVVALLDSESGTAFKALSRGLTTAIQALTKTTNWLLTESKNDVDLALAGATPYMRLFGTAAGGMMMARSALAAQAALQDGTSDRSFHETKLVTAQFYAENILPQADGLATIICDGHHALLALPEDQF